MEKMTYTKKWLFSIVSLMVLTAFALVLFSSRVGAQPSSVTFQATATATTTVSYMTPGTATTTYQFDSPTFSAGKEYNNAQTDKVALYVDFIASSTTATLVITPQFSNNGIDWYGYNSPALTPSSYVTGYTPLASTSISYFDTPGAIGTSTQVFILPDVPSQHERVVYSLQIGDGNGAVYSEVDLKKNPSTP